MLLKIIKKITTKPIWWWERNKNYTIRQQWTKLTPLSCPPIASNHLVVLSTTETLDDAVWSTWSWLRQLGFSVSISPIIVVDGLIPTGWLEQVAKILPNIEVITTKEVIDGQFNSYPSLESFANFHPLGKKLLLILILQTKYELLYSDADVLAFNRPVNLLNCMNKKVACYNQESISAAYDPAMLEAGDKFGWVPAEKLNSGLLYIPKDAISIETADKLLSYWQSNKNSWFSEQTAIAILMQNIGAIALPVEKYVLSNARQFWWEQDIDYSKVHTRHFTGTVRHLMYHNGMPYLFSDSNRQI